MSHTYVIAEAGSTHDGSLDRARELVQIAKEAGCDAFKMQYWSDPYKLAERRHAPELDRIYAKYQVPEAWLEPLEGACKAVGIDFMCTTYLPEDIHTVAMHVAKFKVASFEALDTNFILDHMPYGKNILVSTGMMDAKETHRLLGLRDLLPEIQLLHCVSAYPAPPESLNLSVIREMDLDGFSDHSHDETLITGALAVAAGARIIEVHFQTYGTSLENPDYGHSFDPDQLQAYIADIRRTEIMCGSGTKAQQEAEKEMARYRVR